MTIERRMEGQAALGALTEVNRRGLPEISMYHASIRGGGHALKED